MSQPASPKQTALRSLPSVDQLLKTQVEQIATFGIDAVTSSARSVIEEMRAGIQAKESAGTFVEESKETLFARAQQELESRLRADHRSGIRRVINATGVLLHTNLGRAPLSDAARAAVAEAAGYCTLEFDEATGLRGRRGRRVENLLKQLTGAEDALVVNNCASAALLVLTVLAQQKETIVSRGELVEIGGDFRVPEVLANSGTRMVEVGTTNRTRLDDYQNAINATTGLIMRIHPSNYRIIGFTASPCLSELTSLAHEKGLPLYEDAGSGVLTDLSRFGLGDEPVVRESIAAGADVVSFSGDKLLGGTQAGLIVGSRAIVDRLRHHSLYRALRADKLCLAALEATLLSHARDVAFAEVPVLRMLALNAEELETRARSIADQLKPITDGGQLKLTIVAGHSAIGGGSGPNTHPATSLIALRHEHLSADQIEQRLRACTPPVIARIAEDRVLLDPRTVLPGEEQELVRAISTLK